MNNNENVIVAAFADLATAEAAIVKLREWDERVREVKLGTIGLVRYVDGVTHAEVVHGGLFNRSLPISDAAVTALGQEIGNRVAVVVAADDFESGMVADTLTRAGGRILANTFERTPEEAAEEAEDVADALEEEALRDAVDKARNSPGRTINPPV